MTKRWTTALIVASSVWTSTLNAQPSENEAAARIAKPQDLHALRDLHEGRFRFGLGGQFGVVMLGHVAVTPGNLVGRAGFWLNRGTSVYGEATGFFGVGGVGTVGGHAGAFFERRLSNSTALSVGVIGGAAQWTELSFSLCLSFSSPCPSRAMGFNGLVGGGLRLRFFRGATQHEPRFGSSLALHFNAAYPVGYEMRGSALPPVSVPLMLQAGFESGFDLF